MKVAVDLVDIARLRTAGSPLSAPSTTGGGGGAVSARAFPLALVAHVERMFALTPRMARPRRPACSASLQRLAQVRERSARERCVRWRARGAMRASGARSYARRCQRSAAPRSPAQPAPRCLGDRWKGPRTLPTRPRAAKISPPRMRSRPPRPCQCARCRSNRRAAVWRPCRRREDRGRVRLRSRWWRIGRVHARSRSRSPRRAAARPQRAAPTWPRALRGAGR